MVGDADLDVQQVHARRAMHMAGLPGQEDPRAAGHVKQFVVDTQLQSVADRAELQHSR
jgi:hypothetical protein